MPNPVLTRAIDAVASGEHLTADHAETVLAEIMGGQASQVETAAFLIALRTKGETVPELIGLARAMRALATPVTTARADLIDTCGTGGGPSTFNVSTTAAIIAAAAGCAVAKHGGRSNTSQSGSADLLEALGVNIALSPEAVATCIDEAGLGFMFAPQHHAAMAHVVPVRKELAVRTVFNFLGPLTNPAGAGRQLLGISDRRFQETVAEALLGLGAERALVVSAEDGLDEFSISARTRVIEVADGGTQEWFTDPAEGFFPPGGDGGSEPILAPRDLSAKLIAEIAAEIAGGTPAENAVATRAVLAGQAGPRRDLALLNAGAAIYLAGRAKSLREGTRLAAEVVDSGAAAERLERLAELSNRLAEDAPEPR